MSRAARLAVTAAVVALLVMPVLADRDDFPLSTYPMYAQVRAKVVSFATAQGLDGEGKRHVLSLAAIGNSDDPLVVAGELWAAIRADRADRRCHEIADRIDQVGLVAVEIVAERHDVIAHAAEQPSLVERTVHARCTIAVESP